MNELTKKTGRPTKYTAKTPRKASEYLETYLDLGEEIPTRAGLAMFLGIDKRTVGVWAEEEGKELFSHVVSKIDQAQELALVHGALNGRYNAKIAALMLAKHGYTLNQQDAGVSIVVNVDRTCGGVVIDGEVVESKT
jgi:hypothetical protein